MNKKRKAAPIPEALLTLLRKAKPQRKVLALFQRYGVTRAQDLLAEQIQPFHEDLLLVIAKQLDPEDSR